MDRTLKVVIVAAALTAASAFAAPPSMFWLLFIDDLHIDFRNTGQFRTMLKTIAGELIQESDTFAVFSTGPSVISIDVTSNRQLLDAAIKKATGNALSPADIQIGSQDVEREVRYRANIALSTARAMFTNLERVRDHRKALIYVSGGYYDAAVHDSLWELTRLAASAEVTIFAIDTRTFAGAPIPDARMERAVWDWYWTTTRDSLRILSEQTGGFTHPADEDLVNTLKRIRTAMRN